MKKRNKKKGFRHEPGPFMNGSIMVRNGREAFDSLKPRRLQSSARKRHYSLGMAGMFLLVLAFFAVPPTLSAQSENDINTLYEEHRESKECISFSFTRQMLDAIDMDVDWQEYTKNVQGDFENIKLIVYEDYQEGVKHLRAIENTVQDWGFGRVSFPEDQGRLENQLKIYSKRVNGFYRHVFLMIEDPDDEEVVFLVFRGKLKVKEA